MERGELPATWISICFSTFSTGNLYALSHSPRPIDEDYVAEICHLVLNGATKKDHIPRAQRSEKLVEAMWNGKTGVLLT